jgi:tight adherence protein B
VTTAAAALLVAGALALWPGPVGSGRVVGMGAGRSSARSWRRPRAADQFGRAAVVLPVAALVGAVLAGAGGAVAGGILAATVRGLRRVAVTERATDAATAGLAETLAAFAAELRTGAAPAQAGRAAGGDAHPLAARAMTLVEATDRLGGDVPAALRSAARREPVAGEHLERLAAAWALADQHGIALAGPVAATAADLRARARVAGGLRAQLAGPRATAAVLAGLPVLGIGLGEGMGAHPWAVLSGSALGQVLLVVGVGFVCAGLAWTARIVAGVTR